MSKLQSIDLDAYLRQSDPFRFIDEVAFLDADTVVRGMKHYSGDEEFFKGHFPGDPLVPGVILVESMAQCCRAWLNKRVGSKAEGFIASIDRAKFIKPVRPKDIVIIEATPKHDIDDGPVEVSRFCTFSCVSWCRGERIAKATLTLYQAAAVSAPLAVQANNNPPHS